MNDSAAGSGSAEPRDIGAHRDDAASAAATPTRAPASFSQRRLWLLDRLLPVRAAYNVGTVRRLTGELDVAALRRAFDELVRRHEALRTRFIVVDGEPMQEIAAEVRLPLEPEDLSLLPPAEREVEARRGAGEEALREFDLQRGPLIRVRLLHLAPDEHWLLITMHHIVSDAWSAAVLAREISALYTAFRAGEESRLGKLPAQYADFAAWQRAGMQGEALERQLAYWRDALKDAPALELPTDRTRPAIPTLRGGRVTFEVDEARARALRDLSRGESATLFMTLLAAFQVLLHRFSGQDDIVVGTPIAGRRRHEHAGLIGFFVNTLVLRGDLSGDRSFRDHLRRVRQHALAAYAHQDLPFEKLVEELAPRRDLSRNPLVQVLLSFHNTARIEWKLPGLEVERLEGMEPTYAIVDLTLTVREIDGALHCSFDYACDLFDAATIESMARQWAMLLDEILRDPDQPVSRLRLMDDSTRARRLAEGNNARPESAPRSSVVPLFAEQARQHPEAAAVIEGEHTLSYAQLDARAHRLAQQLQALDIAPASRVGVCMERSIEEIVAFLAVLRAGCTYVPLDPRHPPERLAHVCAMRTLPP